MSWSTYGKQRVLSQLKKQAGDEFGGAVAPIVMPKEYTLADACTVLQEAVFKMTASELLSRDNCIHKGQHKYAVRTAVPAYVYEQLIAFISKVNLLDFDSRFAVHERMATKGYSVVSENWKNKAGFLIQQPIKGNAWRSVWVSVQKVNDDEATLEIGCNSPKYVTNKDFKAFSTVLDNISKMG